MWANTCWGLLGLAASCWLTVLGLAPESAYHAPLLWGGGASLALSVVCFSWPLRHERNRTWLALRIKAIVSRVEPWQVIVIALAVALGGVIWQQLRSPPDLSPPSLQRRIDSFLAKRGKKADYNALHQGSSDTVVIMQDDSDGAGPYIAFWTDALGPWPTAVDGFTAQQLRRSPATQSGPAPPPPVSSILKRQYQGKAKERLEEDLVAISRTLNGPGSNALELSQQISQRMSPGIGYTWSRFDKIPGWLEQIQEMLNDIHSKIWIELIRQHRDQAEDLTDAVQGPEMLNKLKQSVDELLNATNRLKRILERPTDQNTFDDASMIYLQLREPFVRDFNAFSTWITQCNGRIDAKIRELNK
jgi:hypothetical protein